MAACSKSNSRRFGSVSRQKDFDVEKCDSDVTFKDFSFFPRLIMKTYRLAKSPRASTNLRSMVGDSGAALIVSKPKIKHFGLQKAVAVKLLVMVQIRVKHA